MDVKSYALGYNAGASQKGGNVSEAELEAAIKKVVPEWALEEEPPEAADVGADPAGTAETKTAALRTEVNGELADYDKSTAVNKKIGDHNVSTESHADLRLELQRLADRLNAALNSTDTSLDDLKEIVAYIKSNKTLIDGITSSKVNVTDIVNNLTTNASNVPLSAAQGVALKLLIDSLEEIVEGKVTAEQVAAQIATALGDYPTTADMGTAISNATKNLAPKSSIPTKVSQLSNDSGYLSPTTGDQRYPAKQATETALAEHGEKITVLEEALANSMVEYAESVEWLEANGDKDRTYHLPDGYEYKYSNKYVEIPFNANDGTGYLNNIPPNVPWGEPYNPDWHVAGWWTSPLVRIDPTKMAAVGNAAESRVTVSGVSKVVPGYNSKPIVVWWYGSDGSQFLMKGGADLASFGTNSEKATPFTIQLKDGNTFNDSNWASVYGVRIGLGISSSDITKEDVKDLVVNIPFFDFAGYKEGWYSTGKLHSNDPAVQENAKNITILRGDVDGLTDEVTALKESAGSVTVNTSEVLYAVGDSITYGTNVGATKEECNANAWPAHLMALNGYDSEKSLNLGISGIGYCTTASGKTVRGVVDGQSFAGADIVTVAIGINDWKNSSATVENFFTEMYYCLNKIRTDNPYCRIFYILPFNFKVGQFASFYALGFKGESDTALCYGNTLQQFVNLMKAKFEEDNFKALNVHVIDMTKTPSITRYNLTTTLGDGLHPTAECHKELAREISRRIINA